MKIFVSYWLPYPTSISKDGWLRSMERAYYNFSWGSIGTFLDALERQDKEILYRKIQLSKHHFQKKNLKANKSLTDFVFSSVSLHENMMLIA